MKPQRKPSQKPTLKPPARPRASPPAWRQATPTATPWPRALWRRILGHFTLPNDDLLREPVYRRLWTSILISSFGGQITVLALPLTAAMLLHATPAQMGVLVFCETFPMVLFSLPAGVWLDRVRKLPVYVGGETGMALGMASVPLAWCLGWLSMGWMFFVALLVGLIQTTAGTAAQIVLTQLVDRSRLVEAHAKNSLATSGAEVSGPALAGALIGAIGAQFALLVNAVLLLLSAFTLYGIRVGEARPARREANFWRDLQDGVRFVVRRRLLVSLAIVVGLWQFCYSAALVVHILFAVRVLGMKAQAVGLSYMGLGLGTICVSIYGNRISRRLGPGPCLVLGIAVCGCGWLSAAFAPVNAFGAVTFGFALSCFGAGAVLIFINFLGLRQAVTPPPMLARMTSTMRWLILLPAGPGALLGGWMGQHWGLRATMGAVGVAALLLAALAWRDPVIRAIRTLPGLDADDAASDTEAVAPGA